MLGWPRSLRRCSIQRCCLHPSIQPLQEVRWRIQPVDTPGLMKNNSKHKLDVVQLLEIQPFKLFPLIKKTFYKS